MLLTCELSDLRKQLETIRSRSNPEQWIKLIFALEDRLKNTRDPRAREEIIETRGFMRGKYEELQADGFPSSGSRASKNPAAPSVIPPEPPTVLKEELKSEKPFDRICGWTFIILAIIASSIAGILIFKSTGAPELNSWVIVMAVAILEAIVILSLHRLAPARLDSFLKKMSATCIIVFVSAVFYLTYLQYHKLSSATTVPLPNNMQPAP